MRNNMWNLFMEDMSRRFENESGISYDIDKEEYYFKNIPGKFLPWSSRNKLFFHSEKELIKNILIDNNIIYMHNLRWYITTPTLGKLMRKLNSFITYEEQKNE